MLYRRIPKTGDELSILGFGCMRLPQKTGRIDEKRAIAQIHSAIDQGINYFDTAYVYHGGASETVLGKALSGGAGKKVRVATKLPHWSIREGKDMERILHEQLGKLRTDHIDYYLLHNLSGKHIWERMRSLGVIEFLERAKKEGRITNIGFSYHGNKPDFREITGGYDWDFCQLQYNFLDQSNQAGTEGLEYAASKGLGIMIMEPLRGGSLGGKIPDDVRRLWDQAPVKRSPAEWALRWVWNRPEVTVVLSGMNEEAHISENIRIAGDARPLSLSDEDLSLIEKATRVYRNMMKIGCTGCGYCMPCPSGVNIPTCFDLYNKKYLFKSKLARIEYVAMLGGVMHGRKGLASQCKKCGVCEQKCPQHLAIPQHLEMVAKEFEGPLMKPISWLVRAVMKVRR